MNTGGAAGLRLCRASPFSFLVDSFYGQGHTDLTMAFELHTLRWQSNDAFVVEVGALVCGAVSKTARLEGFDSLAGCQFTSFPR